MSRFLPSGAVGARFQSDLDVDLHYGVRRVLDPTDSGAYPDVLGPRARTSLSAVATPARRTQEEATST